jgi:hypothetical protein
MNNNKNQNEISLDVTKIHSELIAQTLTNQDYALSGYSGIELQLKENLNTLQDLVSRLQFVGRDIRYHLKIES